VIDSTGTHKGEVNADIGTSGGTRGIGWIDLFANGNINIADGNGNGANVFAVHANGGRFQNSDNGGLITIKSIGGNVTATGDAIQADSVTAGSIGGQIFIEANKNISFDGGNIFARGDANGTGGFGVGGIIGSLTAPIRAYTGFLHWTTGIGDVLPTGTGVPVAQRGQINLQACSVAGGVTLGATFPAIPAGTFTPNIVAPSCANVGPTLPAYATPFPLANCLAQCGLPPATGKTGTKFRDTVGGAGLPNWEFVIFDNTNTQVAKQFTDASGKFAFTLANGTYTICEVLQAGWNQTFPAVVGGTVVSCGPPLSSPDGPLGPLGYRFTLNNNVETGNNFANHLPPAVCKQDPSVKTCQCTVDSNVAPDPDNCVGPPGLRVCPHLADPLHPGGSCYPDNVVNNNTICINTPLAINPNNPPPNNNYSENSEFKKDLTLRITECHDAKIVARDQAKPAVTINGPGVLTIVGPDTIGGSIGWLIESDNNELKSIGATGASTAGIEVDGDNNTININSVSNNGTNTFADAGILVNGSFNTLRPGGAVTANCGCGILIDNTASGTAVSGNQSNGNSNSGFCVTANTSNTTLDSNKANNNGAQIKRCIGLCNPLPPLDPTCGAGFSVPVDLPNMACLKGNQSNQSPNGGKNENLGAEYYLGSDVNNGAKDCGGNKCDNHSVKWPPLVNHVPPSCVP
jgi:hypothetical protein